MIAWSLLLAPEEPNIFSLTSKPDISPLGGVPGSLSVVKYVAPMELKPVEMRQLQMFGSTGAILRPTNITFTVRRLRWLATVIRPAPNTLKYRRNYN